MTEVPSITAERRPVQEVAVGEVVTIRDAEVVVLGPTPNGLVEAFRDGDLVTYLPGTSAEATADADRRVVPVTEALVGIDFLRRCSDDERNRQAEAHRETLARIRQYAIDKHLDGTICRQGLDDFLQSFEMAEFEPRLRVSYSIRGSYEVEDIDASTARTEAQNIGVDLSEVEDALADSATEEIEVDQIDRVED